MTSVRDTIEKLLDEGNQADAIIKCVRAVRDSRKESLAETLDKEQAALDAKRKAAGLPVRGAKPKAETAKA